MAKKEREAKGKQYRPKKEADDGPAPKPKPKSRRARRAIEAKEPKLVRMHNLLNSPSFPLRRIAMWFCCNMSCWGRYPQRAVV